MNQLERPFPTPAQARVLKLLLPGTGLKASLLARSTEAGTDFSKVRCACMAPCLHACTAVLACGAGPAQSLPQVELGQVLVGMWCWHACRSMPACLLLA